MSNLNAFAKIAEQQNVVIEVMIEKVLQLKSDLATAGETNDDLADHMDRLFLEKFDAETANSELTESLAAANRGIDRLKGIIEKFKAGTKTHAEEMDCLRKSITAQGENLDSKDGEIEHLKNLVQVRENKLVEKAAEVERLKSMIGDCDNELATSKKKVFLLERDNEVLASSLAKADIEIADLRLRNG